MSRKVDLAWGARKGIFWGCLYVALAGVLYAVDGGPRRFDKHGVNVGVLAVVYLLGGLLGGLILGAFRSALQKRSSATAVSILAATPISILGTMLVGGRVTGWTGIDWFTAAAGSVLFGGIGMAVLWKDRDWL